MADLAAYNKYEGLLGFKYHPIAAKYLQSESQCRAIIKGNQGGGTKVSMQDLCFRLLGIHPVKRRNILNKPIRVISKCLPKSDADEENQQYVELRKILPAEFIKQDVTARSKIMTIRNPLGASDNKVEFMASTQDLDAFMSVQRSALYQDEEIDRLKWDECQMRLLKEGGDSTITLTPVRGLDWTFDSIWNKAKRIYRSKAICDKFGFPPVEDTNSSDDKEVFCWATDDNPAMDAVSIQRIFSDIDDPDMLAMRRYGVFRQVSGRIYKAFDEKVHKQPFDKVFDPSLFRTYWNYRVIDYHPSKPWYITFVVITPTHEWIVWNEMLATHDRKTTLDIRNDIKAESLLDEDEEFNRATIIDPLAKVKQPNTGFSVFDDLRMGEYGLRRCMAADTKNTQGQMNIKMRLNNAATCGVPGNNLNKSSIQEERYGEYLPTLWILDNCKGHIEHLRNWRYLDYQQERVKANRTVKRVSEKYSDYCRNLEFLGALNPVFYRTNKSHYSASNFFQGNRKVV